MTKIHDLKIWPQFYQLVFDQDKNFEGRKNDRNYKKGDILVLREFNPITKEYTGRKMARLVTYILHSAEAHGLVDDYVVMSLALLGYERSTAAIEAVNAARTKGSGDI